MKQIFLEKSSFKQHLDAQNTNYVEYLAHLILLLYKYNVNVRISNRANILAAAMHRSDNGLSKFLMSDYSKYDARVILKTCKILDSRRLKAQIAKRPLPMCTFEYLDKLNCGVHVSLTNSKCKLLRRHWLGNIEPNELLSKTTSSKVWKKIIDLLHAKRTDFQLDSFVEDVFNGSIKFLDNCNKEWIPYNREDVDDGSYDAEIGILTDVMTRGLNDDIISLCRQYLDGTLYDDYEPEHIMVTI